MGRGGVDRGQQEFAASLWAVDRRERILHKLKDKSYLLQTVTIPAIVSLDETLPRVIRL